MALARRDEQDRLAAAAGEAILFVTPRERGMLRAIERATRQTIEPMNLPGAEAVNDRRIAKFMQRIDDTLTAGGLDLFRELVARYEREHDVPALDIAAALARLVHGEQPLLLAQDRSAPKPDVRTERPPRETAKRERAPREFAAGERPPRADAERPPRERTASESDVLMETFRIEVGRIHGVKPANIVGAIANEAGLDSGHIGRIEIRDDHSLVDLPAGMPADVFKHLKRVWVSGQQLRISRPGDRDESPRPNRPGPPPRRDAGRGPPKRKPGPPRR